jgi:predicted dehydrogenase
MSAEQNATDRILKVGIIGAGSNSDYHINFSKAYKGAQIVGIADADLSTAKECASRHEIHT